jgi:nucleoside diphosphate kinase
MTTPTQTVPDVAREIIKGALAQHTVTNLAVQIHRSVITDDILAALAAAGFTIAGPGMVAVSREDAEDYRRRIDKDVFHSRAEGYTELRQRQDRIHAALASDGEPT